MSYPDSVAPASCSSPNCSPSSCTSCDCSPMGDGSTPSILSANNFTDSSSAGTMAFAAAGVASASANAAVSAGSGSDMSSGDSCSSCTGASCSSTNSIYSSHPIRYANGEVRLVSGDLSSRGYGQPWSHTRSYSNRLNGTLEIKQNRNGAQWFLTDMPQLAQDGSGNIAVISVINDPLWFDNISGNYVARYFIKETLVADTSNQ